MEGMLNLPLRAFAGPACLRRNFVQTGGWGAWLVRDDNFYINRFAQAARLLLFKANRRFMRGLGMHVGMNKK